MSEHTPGPWQVTEWLGCDIDRGRVVVECVPVARLGGRVVAFIRGSPNMPPEEVMPNAHLIAAAPKLLAALKKLIVYTDCHPLARCTCGEWPSESGHSPDCPIGQAREAIEETERES